jgi:phospholipid/cholesterol/gamma-HCH transport system ATP-binding protein
MLRVDNISRAFGPRTVLHNVSFELPEGSLTGLIGPGGAGKSVLLKVMGGVFRPQSGRVFVSGVETSAGPVDVDGGIRTHRIARAVTNTPGGSEATPKDLALMFQEGALFDSLTVYDNVAFPLVGGQVPAAHLPAETARTVHEKVTTMLERVGLSAAAYKVPGQLSGGMRKRVSLARALVARPHYVMLDDPTAGLDPVASSVIMNLIVEMHREYQPTMLIVSQDLRRLLPVVEKVFALFDGTVRFQGTLQDLLNSSDEYLKKFVSCRFDIEGHNVH